MFILFFALLLCLVRRHLTAEGPCPGVLGPRGREELDPWGILSCSCVLVRLVGVVGPSGSALRVAHWRANPICPLVSRDVRPGLVLCDVGARQGWDRWAGSQNESWWLVSVLRNEQEIRKHVGMGFIPFCYLAKTRRRLRPAGLVNSKLPRRGLTHGGF
jgi:hypothetical protein